MLAIITTAVNSAGYITTYCYSSLSFWVWMCLFFFLVLSQSDCQSVYSQEKETTPIFKTKSTQSRKEVPVQKPENGEQTQKSAAGHCHPGLEGQRADRWSWSPGARVAQQKLEPWSHVQQELEPRRRCSHCQRHFH